MNDDPITAALLPLITGWRDTAEVRALTAELVAELGRGSEPFVGRPLPEALTSGRLPAGAASAWVFVLRPGTRNPAHLHPGSTQRTAMLSGSGRCFAGDREQELEPFDAARPETLLTFPAGTPHAFLPGAEPLVVISFHSVPAHEVVEVEVEGHRQRTYVESGADAGRPRH